MVSDDGGNVSAGEKQLITIARAFLARPQLLILDEATSSVDTRTELLIQHAMGELRRDRTSFIIAHRLSTIRDADVILVMEAGKIVERGSHDELLARRDADHPHDCEPGMPSGKGATARSTFTRPPCRFARSGEAERATIENVVVQTSFHQYQPTGSHRL